jgi:hypothetical protein
MGQAGKAHSHEDNPIHYAEYGGFSAKNAISILLRVRTQ